MFQSCIKSFIFFVLAIGSFALLLTANVATIGKNTANSEIFLIGLNMNKLNSVELLPQLSVSHAAAELGFASNYVFGLYGYCRGDSELDTQTVESIFDDNSLKNAWCSKPKAAYYINPVEFVVDEVNNHNTLGLKISKDDIALPGDLQDKIGTIKRVSYLMYITSIISIAASLVSIALYLLCICCGGTFLSLLAQSIAFITSVLFAGSATGIYTFVRNQFNNHFDQFGIKAVLSYRFLAIAWVGAGLSLLTLIYVIFSSCCCIPTPSFNREKQNPYGERIL